MAEQLIEKQKIDEIEEAKSFDYSKDQILILKENKSLQKCNYSNIGQTSRDIPNAAKYIHLLDLKIKSVNEFAAYQFIHFMYGNVNPTIGTIILRKGTMGSCYYGIKIGNLEITSLYVKEDTDTISLYCKGAPYEWSNNILPLNSLAIKNSEFKMTKLSDLPTGTKAINNFINPS